MACMGGLTFSKKAASDSTRTPSAANAFDIVMHAPCAAGVRAEAANSGVWFPQLGSIGIASGRMKIP